MTCRRLKRRPSKAEAISSIIRVSQQNLLNFTKKLAQICYKGFVANYLIMDSLNAKVGQYRAIDHVVHEASIILDFLYLVAKFSKKTDDRMPIDTLTRNRTFKIGLKPSAIQKNSPNLETV